MKDELIKILPDLKLAIEQGVTYAGDLFNRAIIYYKLSTIVGIVISFLLTILGIHFIKKFIKLDKEDEDEEKDIILAVVFGIIGLFAFMFSMFFIFDLIKLYTIPEIYILQLLT